MQDLGNQQDKQETCNQARPVEPGLPPNPGNKSHRQAVVDLFNLRFAWWSKVYDDNLPRGFFSYEMCLRRKMVISAVTEHMKARKGLRILECGCGPGGILNNLPTTGHKVLGTDINPAYLTKMRNSLPHVCGVCCDLEKMPFGDNLFDVVICVGVLPYLSRDDLAIAEMSRLLKPGGLLVISNPGYFMIDKLFDPYYLLVWPVRQVKRLLGRRLRPSAAIETEFPSSKIRRFRFGQLDSLYRLHDLKRCIDRPVSYGPLRFWRKEVFSLHTSVRFSENLVRLADKQPWQFLQRWSNHRVIGLQKTEAGSGKRRGEHLSVTSVSCTPGRDE